MTDIQLRVTATRAEGLILGDLIAAQEGDLRAMRDTLAHFAVNGTGEYMESEDAKALIGALTLGEMRTYSGQLQGSLREEAVPKEPEPASDSPSSTDSEPRPPGPPSSK